MFILFILILHTDLWVNNEFFLGTKRIAVALEKTKTAFFTF